jgi:hypothetical protein
MPFRLVWLVFGSDCNQDTSIHIKIKVLLVQTEYNII